MAAASEIFPLASRPPGMARLTPFLVKVTDSGLSALNEALNGSGGGCIAFSPNCSGLIRFDANGRPFKFTMSDLQKDLSAKGTVEAVEHFADTGRWHKLGLTAYRATIMATDDSYQSTKRKALQAEEEAKKGSAKVLRQPKVSTKGNTKMWRKVCDSVNVARRPQTMTKVLTTTAAVAATGCGGGGGATVASVQNSTAGGGNCSVDGGGGQARGLDIRKKSLRERIVHQLLVNCCTSKDLLSRMTKEGLTPDERQNFDAVFMAVAQPKTTVSSKSIDEPIYELKAQCLSEVNDDWPFYSNWHRQLAKRALSSRISSGAKGADTSDQLVIPERRSASTKCRPYAGSQNSKFKNQQATPSSYSIDSRQQQLTGGKRSSSATVDHQHQSAVVPPYKERRVDQKLTTKTNGHSAADGATVPSLDANSPSSDNLNLCDEYPEINTYADRRRYKELFDSCYPQYQQCYEKLKAVLDEFTALEAQLEACKRGSAEFEAVERRMSNRYRHYLADQSLDKLRKEHDALRSKLSTIKARVDAFDSRCETKDDHRRRLHS